MGTFSDSPLDRLWKEYSEVFQEFDDLTLARWMSQTLGQIQGRVWRLSHPLIGCYRLSAQLAHERQIWLKRMVHPPATYPEAGCCRAPLLPLVTRDVLDSGLICQHCSGTAVEFDELPEELRLPLGTWAREYGPVHSVAHWDESQRANLGSYERAFENAALEAEKLLLQVRQEVLPRFLDYFPAVLWEDQDECLEVRPEDIQD